MMMTWEEETAGVMLRLRGALSGFVFGVAFAFKSYSLDQRGCQCSTGQSLIGITQPLVGIHC